MTTETIDQAKLGAFMERVLGDAAGLMTSTQVTLGDRLGLFRAIAGEPTTSGELAAAADINERYAREWLRGMHAAGYLELDRGTGRYATEEDTAQGAASLAKYLANLIRAKMQSPSEDLVSDLAERVNADELSVREATQLALGVLIAGHETTANMISLSIAALLEHPDQGALMRDTDDPKVIATAVEELMRYLSIIQTGQRRIAVEDIEIGGETIRAGEGIILDVAPANWDGRQFPNPDRLDLQREDGSHVGFGYGRHQCVGQQLARMELQIVLPTLLRRIPTLRLAVPLEGLPFKHDTLAYGVYELPVAW